jgi:hypothetical protein
MCSACIITYDNKERVRVCAHQSVRGLDCERPIERLSVCVCGCIRAWQHVAPVFSLPPLSFLLYSRYSCGVTRFESSTQYGNDLSVSENWLSDVRDLE